MVLRARNTASPKTIAPKNQTALSAGRYVHQGKSRAKNIFFSEVILPCIWAWSSQFGKARLGSARLVDRYRRQAIAGLNMGVYMESASTREFRGEAVVSL